MYAYAYTIVDIIKPKGYWKDIENRKKFFLEFASRHGFDAASPEGWSNVTNIQLLNNQVPSFTFHPLTLFNLFSLTFHLGRRHIGAI